jgi:hypothetical protein
MVWRLLDRPLSRAMTGWVCESGNATSISRKFAWYGMELSAIWRIALCHQRRSVGRATRFNTIGEPTMRISSGLRAALIALTALTGASLSSAAQADEGFINITVVKAGWIIGGSGGSGTLTFQGRRYPLSVGGISYGLVFGAAKTNLRGRVSNIFRPSDVAGVYGAAGAGLAVGRGASAIVLTNQKGAVLEVSGREVGLLANADLSGLAITLR